jgi:hypothetical protein
MAEGRQTLLDDLEGRSDDAFASGRTNNLWHIWLSILTILASLFATVLAAADELPRVVLAASAALPAAFAAAQKTFQPRRLAQWYFLKSARIGAIWTELSFDDAPDMKAYAKRLGEVELDMEKLWKDIGEDTVPPALTEQRKARAATRRAKSAS